jgi:serine/threonine protein kinase
VRSQQNLKACKIFLVNFKSFDLLLLYQNLGPLQMFRRYSYSETKIATNNFSTEIGKGGFGTVFKARFNDGSVVAVKRMDKVSKQGQEEFCREIELLARLHHRHLVMLKGFCVEGQER